MRYFIAFFFALSVSFFTFAENDSCSVVSFDNDDCPLKGRVKIVNAFPDITVKIVDAFADVNVKVCSVTDNECGHIKIVDAFPDIYIKIVDSFADVTIKFEDEKSKENFIKALKNIK